MHSRLTVVLAAAALVFLAPTAARAQPVSSLSGPGPDTWIDLHLGAALPQHGDLDELDPGYAIGGAFGARFSPYLGAEFGVGYWRAVRTSAGLERTASDVPLTANLRLRAPGRVVEVSVAAGVGMHVATYSARAVTAAGPLTLAASSSATSVAFGGQVGAALGFHLSPTMLLGASVERSFVAPRFHDRTVRFDALLVAANLTYHL
jgi:hypothetical protein